jgi:hypothetical protein
MNLAHVRTGHVVDCNGVCATKNVEINLLDTIEIHRDAGDVTGQQRPCAVGGNINPLVDVCAVEKQNVGAALSLDHIAAVAGIPEEDVVAGAKKCGVIATVAIDDIVAVPADQDVVA